jgi:hypothetical protein
LAGLWFHVLLIPVELFESFGIRWVTRAADLLNTHGCLKFLSAFKNALSLVSLEGSPIMLLVIVAL